MKESIKSNKRINPVDRITDRILAAWNGSFQPISAQRRNQTPAIGIAQGSLKDRSRIDSSARINRLSKQGWIWDFNVIFDGSAIQ